MQKNAFLFSAGEYLDSRCYPRRTIDLPGVKYDIDAMKKRLEQIGFNMTVRENAIRSEIFETIREKSERLPQDAISVVFFTGHGGHNGGNNYIYPSDFGPLIDQRQVLQDASINIKDIISLFRGKGYLILILDSCRNDFDACSNAYYSELTHAENVYIAYATKFNTPAFSKKDGLSYYTEAICDEILTPNISVDTLFTRIRSNVYRKYNKQLPISVNGLLQDVFLNRKEEVDLSDEQVHAFIKRYGDEYVEKHGYFHGDDLVFIDAAQYFDISLLDSIWIYHKVEDHIYRAKGVKLPELTEQESKIVTFLGFTKSKKFFSHDESHTWYYDGRQIRMGEIPPLPPSMQQKLPIEGMEIDLTMVATKTNDIIRINTNLPNGCKIHIIDNINRIFRQYIVHSGIIEIADAFQITKIEIDSTVQSDDKTVNEIIGENGRNLTGQHIVYHPIYGNQVRFVSAFT